MRPITPQEEYQAIAELLAPQRIEFAKVQKLLSLSRTALKAPPERIAELEVQAVQIATVIEAFESDMAQIIESQRSAAAPQNPVTE